MGKLNFADAFTLELPSDWIAREKLPRGPLPVAVLDTGSEPGYFSLTLTPGSKQSGELPVEAILVGLGDDEENSLHHELVLPPPQHPSGLPYARGTRPGREKNLRVHLGLILGKDAGLMALLVCGPQDEDLVASFEALVASARLRRPWWKFW